MNKPYKTGTLEPLFPLRDEILEGEILQNGSQLFFLEGGGEDYGVKHGVGLPESLLEVEVVPVLHQLLLHLIE